MVHVADVDAYLETYRPVQLRDSKRTNVNDNYAVFNFGDSKGLTFDRTLIYPTAPMEKWVFDHNTELQPKSRARFYVAVTRARYSVAIIVKNTEAEIPGVSVWKREE